MGLKPFFPRVGGKSKSCAFIARHMPEHETYVEPFVGGGSVFFAKPRSAVEVLNDVDRDIYDLWNDLPHVRPVDFAAAMNAGDGEEHRAAFYRHRASRPEDPHERFLRNMFLSLNSYGATRCSYSRRATPLLCTKLRRLPEYQERVRGVTLHNEDWEAVVARYDGPGTLFYLDPPYATGYRRNWGYKQLVEPEQVARVCRGLRGKFMLSYCASPRVRELFGGFTILDVPTEYSLGSGKRAAGDILVMNFETGSTGSTGSTGGTGSC